MARNQNVESILQTLVPLNDMCSRKCAVPLLTAFSYLLPASIQTPTVAVSVKGRVSEATRNPLGNVVIYGIISIGAVNHRGGGAVCICSEGAAARQYLRLWDCAEDLLVIGQLRDWSGKSEKG